MKSQSSITVRYAETDQMGVAHHASYPVWYEVARTDFIKTLGITYSEMEAMGVMTPLVELNCRYISATRYEDVLTVETSVSVLSPARIQFDYTIRRQGEPKPVNTGSTMHAWVDSKTFRPINLKKSYPDLYRKILDVMETREE